MGRALKIAAVAGLSAGLLLLARRAWGPTVNIIQIDAKFAATALRARKLPIRGIAIHHTATSTPASTRAALRSSGYATVFEVDQAGNVYQYVDPARWYTITTQQCNDETIGIDLTHRSGAPWPEVQVEAARALVHFLAARFGLTVKVLPDIKTTWKEARAQGYTVVRHRNFHPTACPEDFPMERLA